MADNSQIIQDLLALPLEERARVHSMNPQVTSIVDSLLSSDPEFSSLPDNEKIAVRANLGFPANPVAPVAPPPPTEENVNAALTALGQPAANSWLSHYKGLLDPLLKELGTPSVKSPITGIDVGSASIPGKIARGIASAIPGLQGMVPPPDMQVNPGKYVPQPGEDIEARAFRQKYEGPDFFSVENAAKMATDMMITAPFIPSAAPIAAAGFFQFFLRNPAFARVVANATAQALPLAAYQTLSRRITESIQKGEISIDGIAKEYGKDVAIGIGMLIGLHGALAGATNVAGKVVRKLGWADAKIVENVASDIGEAPKGVPRQEIVPEPGVAPPEVVSKENMPNILVDRPRIEPENPPVIEPPFTELTPPEPTPPLPPGTLNLEPQSPTSLLLEQAQKQTVPILGTAQETLAAAQAAVAPPKPGFMLTAEEKLRGKYPKASEIVDTVLGPNKTEVTPSGAVQATIPNTALESTFVAPAEAMVGDTVLVNGKIVTVLEKSEKGLTVQPLNQNVKFFIEHAKVQGKAELPFKPGDSVFKQTGEPVTVAKIIGRDMVQVIDAKGTRYAMPTNKLMTESKASEVGKAIENVQNGIDEPPTSGHSVWDSLTNERGAWRPFAKGDHPSGTIPVSATVQPDKKKFGTMRWWWAPEYTLLGMNDPKYTLAAQMMNDAKGVEQVIEGNGSTLIKSMREMIGAERGASWPMKFAEGGNDEASKRMTRALLGVPLPGETLTTAEEATVSSFKDFGQKTIIPLLNERRAALGLKPVPNDYNYLLNLFPELILSAGYRGNGIAKTIAPMIKVLGQDNLIDTPFSQGATRIEVNANFWEVADRLVKFAAHETAWRDALTYISGLAKAETIHTNKDYLNWLVRHVEGKQIDPAVSDAIGFSSRIDDWLVRNGYRKDTTVFTASNGDKVVIPVPAIAFGDKNLSAAVMSMRSLNYLAMIGFNARTLLLNLTQPVTNGMAQIPGSPIAAAFDTLAGYSKGVASLFSKEMQRRYHELGILQDVEDLFAPATMTKTTGNLWLNTAYANSWLWNNVSSLAFAGMRMAEIINRVTVFEARRSATMRIAEQKGISPDILKDPNFIRSVEDLSKYTTNISNFLYGKGFKSPMQESKLTIGRSGIGFGPEAGGGLELPIGELMYMFNTFATHHWGNMTMLARQAAGFGGHQNAAARMALSNTGSAEFADYIARLEPSNRTAFLKALVYQSTLGMFLSSYLGLTSIASQISPFGLTGINLYTPLLKSIVEMVQDVTSFDPVGFGRKASRAFMPGANAAQRYARGGSWTNVLFATRSDLQGGKSPYSNETANLFFNPYAGGSRAGVR